MRYAAFACSTILLFTACITAQAEDSKAEARAPRIVNIVNFIRLLEPRSDAITEDVLYETVVKQTELMKQHKLPGTFLLQYDALMEPRYQQLLQGLPDEQFEIGAWWELPQPLVEKAGLEWRGRFPWDWHADVGFASGYTPEQREKLVDVYMADFKKAFGYYPKSVASWFIDAHTLQYMRDRYGIVASANCKDQVGTDGYTLWGGYWNQAYYPSKVNAYMPAQTESQQIPVPVFRMLGSDPLRQYDTGIGHTHQGVISLEPVYGDSGGDPAWVDWFLENFVDGECLAFNYTQAGQENSFTWDGMHRGLEYQFPLIAQLRDEGKVRVETLHESGEWFRRNFETTPATSMTYQTPLRDDTRQTVWFNSRFYRTSLIWQDGHLRIRDIHLFDESVESPILKQKIAGPAVEFYAQPVVDGFHWSSREVLAGIVFQARIDGQDVELTGGEPEVTSPQPGELRILWPLTNVEGTFVIELTERTMHIALEGSSADWWAEFRAAPDAKLPFTGVQAKSLDCSFQSHDYRVDASEGSFTKTDGGFRILPAGGGFTLELAIGGE